MGCYLVKFDERGVIYMPDHPRVKKWITVLPVTAPSAKGAETHAIRCTRGEGEVIEVIEVEQFPTDHVPAVEVDNKPTIRLNQGQVFGTPTP